MGESSVGDKFRQPICRAHSRTGLGLKPRLKPWAIAIACSRFAAKSGNLPG